MFCPECGKPNDSNAVFCYHCGIRIQAQDISHTRNAYAVEQQQVPMRQHSIRYTHEPQNADGTMRAAGNGGNVAAQKKSVNKKLIALIAVFGGIFAALVIAFIVIMVNFTPEKTAEKYVDAIIDGDYSKAYSYIYDSEAEYFTENQFADYMSNYMAIYTFASSAKRVNCKDAVEAGLYQNSTGDASEKMFNCYVDFSSAGYNDGMTVSVVKTGALSYKVSVASDLVMNISVRTAKGSTVTIDGIKLTVKEDENTNSHKYASYKIDALLEGNHDLVIENPIYETIEKEIRVDDYSKTFNYSELDLKAAERTKVFNQATEIFKSMCAASMSSKDFSAVSGKITSDANVYSDLVADYNTFKNHIKNSSGMGYSSLNFTQFVDDTIYYGVENNKYTCRVKYTYDSVSVYKNYYSATGYSQRTTKGAQGYISMTFEIIDGEWTLIAINDYRI